MSDAGKAVFLSYASQDAAAAQRIAEALRAAGVEVWFDRDELVGGDAWDAKIRRQIKECALFIPVISANTQARTEGYFRLEWRLADQRTHLMAKGRAFLVPVVIDDTNDADAQVPDSFTEVQWTRLPGGETPAKFGARVRSLLEGGPASAAQRASPSGGAAAPRPAPWAGRRVGRFLWVAGALVACGGAALVFWPRPAPSPATAAALTEAQKLTRQAKALLDDDPLLLRENYFLADELAQRAVKADPTDGEAWAVAGRASAFLVARRYDASSARRDLARLQVERAMSLAPTSVESAFAQALQQASAGRGAEARAILEELTRRAPADWRLWHALGGLHGEAGEGETALRLFREAEARSGGDARPVGRVVRTLIRLGRLAEARSELERVMAGRPGREAYLGGLLFWGIYVYDVAAAQAFIARIPPRVLQEDAIISTLAEFYLRTGEGDRALEELRRMPRDFFEDGWDWRPKGYLAGYAHQVAGRQTAAQAEWRQALAVVEKRLAAEPNETLLLFWRCLLQALTGQVAEARAGHQLWRELAREPNVWFDAILLAALGDRAAAVEALVDGWPGPDDPARLDFWGDVLHAPWFAAIRDDPRIRTRALKEKAAIDRQLQAPEATVPSGADPSAAAPAKVDAKSVAVLPFANLSGDPAQEYFSDGLTEEVLNALARERDLRVPGRASSFSFKGRNVPSTEVAKALNVARLVEGSVRRSGGKVRISVSLTRASDGFSEELGTFTEEFSDLFALQDKVAAAVVAKLTNRAAALRAAAPTSNLEAYDAYLRGRMLQTRSYDDLSAAAAHYQRAVELDERFALAWVRLAECRFRFYGAANDRSPGLIESVERAVARAIELDPRLPEALAMRAHFRREMGDVAGAVSDLDAAERLVPGSGELRLARALLARRNLEWEAVYRGLEQYLETDPFNGDSLHFIGRLHEQRGLYAQADRLFARAVAIHGRMTLPYRLDLRQKWRGATAALAQLDRLAAASGDNLPLARLELLSIARREREARDLAVAIEQRAAEAASGGLPRVSSTRLRTLGLSELAVKRASEERAWSDAQLARGNRAPNVLLSAGWSLWAQGEEAAVGTLLAEIEASVRRTGDRHRYFVEYALPTAPLHAAIGQRERALALLEEALAAGYHLGHQLREHPEFDPLRGDPRFEAMVASELAWAQNQPDPID